MMHAVETVLGGTHTNFHHYWMSQPITVAARFISYNNDVTAIKALYRR
jgi:hypothetical protein